MLQLFNREMVYAAATHSPLNGTTRSSYFQVIIPMGSGPGTPGDTVPADPGSSPEFNANRPFRLRS